MFFFFFACSIFFINDGCCICFQMFVFYPNNEKESWTYLCFSPFMASSMIIIKSAVLATAITWRPRPLPGNRHWYIKSNSGYTYEIIISFFCYKIRQNKTFNMKEVTTYDPKANKRVKKRFTRFITGECGVICPCITKDYVHQCEH